MPAEPAMAAPQNPVAGTRTPGRRASPTPHAWGEASLSSTPGGGAGGTAVSGGTAVLRKRGKRLVFARQPAVGQVVLPEHPVGIGLNLSSSDRGGSPFYVESLLGDSPAAKCAQVGVGDVVYSIDGVRVKDKSLPQVIQMLKGPSGTQVTVVFQVPDRDPKMPSASFAAAPQQAGPGWSRQGVEASMEAFEARLDLVAAEGLPTSGTSDTGLCDAYLCVSLLPESVEPEPGSALVVHHKRHAQANTKTCRSTLNPVWKETHTIRDMHNESVLMDSNRPLPSAHERTPLSGQAFTMMLTVHSENGRGDDFVGSALLRNVRGGPCSEHKLALLDARGAAVGFGGQVAMVHVRLTYGLAQGDVHQAEAARKAADMAASRKRRLHAPGPVANSSASTLNAHGTSSGASWQAPKALLPAADSEASSPSVHVAHTNGVMTGSDSGMLPLVTAAATATGIGSGWQRGGTPASPPAGLAALWVEAYANKTTSAAQPRTHDDVHTDVLAFVAPPSLMSTPTGPMYGDKRARAPDVLNGSSNGSASMLDQIRLELQGKDKALAALHTEHARLHHQFQHLSRLNETSVESSASALARLKEQVEMKTQQMRQLQSLVDTSQPAQQRLEQQLSSAQQLVRGSLLQHERYEATTEHQSKEILQLKRDKDRVERELNSLRSEHQDLAYLNAQPDVGGASTSLKDLIDQERRRFKNALAQERQRSEDALDRQRAEMQQMQHTQQQLLQTNKVSSLSPFSFYPHTCPPLPPHNIAVSSHRCNLPVCLGYASRCVGAHECVCVIGCEGTKRVLECNTAVYVLVFVLMSCSSDTFHLISSVF